MQALIQKIQHSNYQNNQNMIYNLSYHSLPEEDFSVLTRSLSFVPTTTKTFKLKQYFFKTAFIKNNKKKSNWTPPPYDKNTLISFSTHVEQELASINTHIYKL